MHRKPDIPQDPVSGSKSPNAGKPPRDGKTRTPPVEDTGETEEEEQARESEAALDRAITRLPPG